MSHPDPTAHLEKILQLGRGAIELANAVAAIAQRYKETMQLEGAAAAELDVQLKMLQEQVNILHFQTQNKLRGS